MAYATARRTIPYIAAAGLVILVGVAVYAFLREKQQSDGMIMAEEITRLAGIFQRIHATCTIISFDYPKNPVNFLNVGTFAGSEVGPMNLAHPEKWEGPYVHDNPTIQGHEYMIVRTSQGHYLTPGDGVLLPNGKVIGTDLMFTENTDIAAMLQELGDLFDRGRALGALIAVGQ